uniref:hypothetical protein n=1 Tax=Rhizobium sp. CFBP 8762 TaxID=2775279 RepID=UPI001FD4F7CF|nr:hypothetical protein [Rhizobium sp. CFBP 8762]
MGATVRKNVTHRNFISAVGEAYNEVVTHGGETDPCQSVSFNLQRIEPSITHLCNAVGTVTRSEDKSISTTATDKHIITGAAEQ